MRVIIAGSRLAGHVPKRPKPTPLELYTYNEAKRFFTERIFELRKQFKDEYGPITEIVSGCATGIDTLAIELAPKLTGKTAKKFEANWFKDGRKAGIIRNELMRKHADGAIIIAIKDPSGKSSIGSFDMAKRMRENNQPYILEVWDLDDLDLHIPGIYELYRRDKD